MAALCLCVCWSGELKGGERKEKADSSVKAKIINEELVGLGAAAGGGSVARGASSWRTQTKPHSSPK